MIVGTQQAGMGIEPPSPYEIKHKYLDMEYKDMEAFYLNPRFQYRCGVGSDPDLVQVVHDVFVTLDPTMEAYTIRDAKRGFNDRATIASRLEMVSVEWWFMYGNRTPTLRRSLHLDDEDGNPDPRIVTHVQEIGVDVERSTVTSRPSFDFTSVEHSSRPSAAGTSASSYDSSRGKGTNDGNDPGNNGGDIRQQQQNGQPFTSLTCEDDFTHCTQDEDHGSRRASPSVGAIGKPCRERQQRMTPYNKDSFSASFESMSIETQFNDSLNKANIYAFYAMGYG
ncbi:hypothetical protein CK203_110013 [Vitis vinifera]|uniref:Uncharacterized protein n=1 Tax=Vitis vinifera TaxID=29760 RepID=A0A438CT10_VITVI|nr:hypothetical protein CK203_110013 [Vitis vinifera]